MIITPNEAKTGTTAGAAAVTIAMPMTARRQYRLTAKGAGLWFKVIAVGDADPTAGGDNCHYLPQNTSVEVAAIASRDHVAIIREAATDATGILSELANVVG